MASSVLVAGGVSRWAVIVTLAAAIVGVISLISSRRKLQGISPLILLIGVAVAVTALQLIPLPGSVLATLNPTGYELVVDSEQLLGSGMRSSWRPLSLDPSNTWVELTKLVSYLLVGWIALRTAATERGRYWILAGVAGVAGLVASIGIVHEVLGATRLYGLYQPDHATPNVMSPLLNSNHLGMLMALGALTASGLALNERRAAPVRALWILIALTCVVVVIATRSRSSVLGLGAGATVTAIVVVLQQLRRSRDSRRADAWRVVLPGAVIVLCSLVLVVYLGGGEVRNELESTSTSELSDPRSKYVAWHSSSSLLSEAPVLGIGRGAFETAFTRVHPMSGRVTFSHIENEYLQAVIDWGAVGALALLGALGFAAVVTFRRWRAGPLFAGALGAVTVVGVQSVVDFGLEVPGVAIPSLLVASTLMYVPLKEASASVSRTLWRSAIVVMAILVAIGCAMTRSLAEDHQDLSGPANSLVSARASLARHPLDYLAAAHVSRWSEPASERVRFLNHALRLHPTHPGLHRAAAIWLVASGRMNQAALEYRLAIFNSDRLDGLINEILRVFPSAHDAAAALPIDQLRWGQIATVLSDAKRHDVALAYLTKLVDAGDNRLDVWRRMLELAEKTGDLEHAERAAAGITRRVPGIAAVIDLARIQTARKNYEAALATLSPTTQQGMASPEHTKAKIMICEIHIARADWPRARECLTSTIQGRYLTIQNERKVHSLLAGVEEAMGNRVRAEFERRLLDNTQTTSKP
ncbi:MAG: O-antigen ligase family protein [Kofleriaceae bacterium]